MRQVFPKNEGVALENESKVVNICGMTWCSKVLLGVASLFYFPSNLAMPRSALELASHGSIDGSRMRKRHQNIAGRH